MADDGILSAFNAPPASQEMFKELADKTNVFTDPLGSETLGAVNRAIVGAPVDAIDMMGRAGETVLRGAAKAGTGIMKALGEDDAMAERFGRDIYQAGMVSGPATALAPIRPRGKSNKTLVLEAQKKKMKSPAGKRALDEDLEEAAITDAFADAADDMTVMYARNTGRMDDEITDQDMLDILTDSYFTNRDRGMSKSDSIAESLFESGLDDVAGPMLKRLDADYNFRSSSAVNRKKEGAASRRSLETQARLARQPQEPIKTVPLEEATRMQNEISGMGLPDRTVPQKPNLTVIEGGSKKKLNRDELFEVMGEDGAMMEFPEIGKNVDKYIYDFDFKALSDAALSPEYSNYSKVMKSNLRSAFPSGKIPVSRTEGYATIGAPKKTNDYIIDINDVLFVGYGPEKELIVKGSVANKNRPVSVAIKDEG